MALTRAAMVRSLVNKLGLSRKDSREMVDSLIEELAAALAAGERVKLSGFGTLDLRDKKAHPGRNPKTGECILIPARRVVTFRAGNTLKARVKEYAGPGNNDELPHA